MAKINNKPLAHNDPTLDHKTRMILRKAQRHSRTRMPYPLEYHFKTGKYTPAEEERKHVSRAKNLSTEASIELSSNN